MKIFAKKSMERQYKFDVLPFDVGVRFTVYKLVVEDCHVYFNEEQDKIRQKLIENLDFTFIRFNSDAEKFDVDVEIARIYNYIKESSVRLAVNSEKSLKEKCAKELLSYVSSISKHLKNVKYFIEKILSTR